MNLPFDPSANSASVTLALVAMVAGLSRGFSGFGSGMIFIPLAGMLVGPMLAAPLLLMIEAVGTLPTLRSNWRPAEKVPVGLMAAGAALSMPLGIFILLHIDPVLLRWFICIFIVCVLLLMISGRRYTGPMTPPVFGGVGIIAGIMSGVAQIGGPPIVAFWLGSTRPRDIVRANIMAYFAMNAILSLIAYGISGLMTKEAALLALVAGPAFFFGLLVGLALYPLAPQKVFRAISHVLIAMSVILSLPDIGLF